MQVKYPLFILEKDDLSMRMIRTHQDLGWFEEPDIEEDLYNGWDSNGLSFNLVWDVDQSYPRIEIMPRSPEIQTLCNVVKEYALRYRPTISFKFDSIRDVIKFFEDAEEYLNERKIWNKIKRMIKKLVGKSMPPTVT